MIPMRPRGTMADRVDDPVRCSACGRELPPREGRYVVPMEQIVVCVDCDGVRVHKHVTGERRITPPASDPD